MYWGDKAIVMAKEAVKIFLHSLPPGSKFNICSFGSHHSYLFDGSQDYNEKNMLIALEDIDQNYLGNSMGGTEIYTPLKEIFENENKSGLNR